MAERMSTGYVSGDEDGDAGEEMTTQEKPKSITGCAKKNTEVSEGKPKKTLHRAEKDIRQELRKETRELREQRDDTLKATQKEDGTVDNATGELTVRDVIEELVRLNRSGGIGAKEEQGHEQIVIEIDGRKEKIPGSAPAAVLKQILRDKPANSCARRNWPNTLLITFCVGLLAYVLTSFGPTTPAECCQCITGGESNIRDKAAIPGLPDSGVVFQQRFNALKKRFPSQDESLWSTLSDTLAPDSPTTPCSMLTLTSLVPFSSSRYARLTLTNLASTLPWLMAREHFTLHYRQFTTVKEEHATEAIADIMRAWSSSDVIVIPDVDSMPRYVTDVVVRTSCQSNEVQPGHVVVMTSEERPEKADSIVVAVLPERDMDEGAPLERTPLENHEEGLAVIRKRFPAQTDRVWQVVGAAILSHIAEADPVKPAVVIIGAPPGAHRTADRLAQALARIYTEKPIAIDSRQFAHVNAARAKLHLDRVLESGLLGNDRRESGVVVGARAVVLTGLEALPGDAAMLFHGYCDHSDAPFKSTAYFFTVHCSDEINPTLHYKERERKVHQELKRAWRNLPATHLDPLLGRITPLTAVVTPERDMELSNE